MGHIAIIGSGPSGCYCADFLAKKLPDSQIDIFDRLPTPFGLLRSGVAPDHQITKNLTKQLARTFERPNVRFIGNLEIGRDIQLESLKQHYDAVVLATGAQQDKQLEGLSELPGVYGSGAVASWYNGHPDFNVAPKISGHLVIIGNGNVALDMARIFSKQTTELASSDISAKAMEAMIANPVTQVTIVGRRGALQASFSPDELAELGQLEAAAPVLDPQQVPKSIADDCDPVERVRIEKNLVVLNQLAAASDASKQPIELLFNAQLQSATPTGGKLALDFATGQGRRILEADSVITAIGYRSQAITGAQFDEASGTQQNTEGKIADGLYCVGWCKHGPRGVIPSNRVEANGVAKQLLAELGDISQSERQGFAALTIDKPQLVDYPGFTRIDEAETAAASNGAPRAKLTDWQALLTAAQES